MSAERARLMSELSAVIVGLGDGRLRVAVDGRTGAGKTAFGHELAAAVRARGRSTARACLDDFKHPWQHSVDHGYDRVTGQGYYRNAWDFVAVEHLLLEPAATDGDGVVALCAHDPLTGESRGDVRVRLHSDTVLIVDGVFAFRPEYGRFWDFGIWIEVSPAMALARGIARDAPREGEEAARRVHQDRYRAAEDIYLAEVRPAELADVVIENSDFAHPEVLSLRPRP
jgi:uridine kinase